MAKGNKTFAHSKIRAKNPHYILALQEKLRKKGLEPNKAVATVAENTLIMNSNVRNIAVKTTNLQRIKMIGDVIKMYGIDEKVQIQYVRP